MEESQGKIRKRGCSSSSSSSLVRNYRLKRAILIGKRVGSRSTLTTPKLKSPVSAAVDVTDLLKFPTGNATNGVVSARKLAASLWEINHVSSPPHSFKDKESSRTTRESRMKEVVVTPSSDPPSDALPEMEKRVRFKDVRKGLMTAKELLKALSHVWGGHSSAADSLVSALRVEIDRVSVQVEQVVYEQSLYRREMRRVMQHLAEENDKVKRVLELAKAELEAERKLRRQTERINKKLGRELAREKRVNEELEHVCEGREEMEELKRASAEAWEEVEMLQLADVLREERVQMKLAEAKYHFEEKNADIEKLRSELEAYMSSNHVATEDVTEDVDDGEESPGSANSEVLRDFLRKTLGKVCQNPNMEDNVGRVDESRDSSSDGDMHSIELELDGSKKSFKWGYSPPAQQDDSKRSSVEVFKGRKSLSEKIQWATISLLKGGSTSKTDNAAVAPSVLLPQKKEIHDDQRPSSSGSQFVKKDQVADENVMKEQKSGKSLKNKIFSSFKLGTSQGCASPAKQWGQAIERF